MKNSKHPKLKVVPWKTVAENGILLPTDFLLGQVIFWLKKPWRQSAGRWLESEHLPGKHSWSTDVSVADRQDSCPELLTFWAASTPCSAACQFLLINSTQLQVVQNCSIPKFSSSSLWFLVAHLVAHELQRKKTTVSTSTAFTSSRPSSCARARAPKAMALPLASRAAVAWSKALPATCRAWSTSSRARCRRKSEAQLADFRLPSWQPRMTVDVGAMLWKQKAMAVDADSDNDEKDKSREEGLWIIIT